VAMQLIATFLLTAIGLRPKKSRATRLKACRWQSKLPYSRFIEELDGRECTAGHTKHPKIPQDCYGTAREPQGQPARGP